MRTCRAPKCDGLAFERGYCQWHYLLWRNQGFRENWVPPKPIVACEAPGCDEDAKTRGYCRKHYQQWRRDGFRENWTPSASRRGRHARRKPLVPPACKVSGCARTVRAQGFCNGHYQIWRRGTLEGFPRMGGPLCKFPSCDEPAYGYGWCFRHYQYWRRRGYPKCFEMEERQTTCKVPACRGPHYARGYCRRHYVAWRSRGFPKDWLPNRPDG